MAREPLPASSWGKISVYRRGNSWQASVRYRDAAGRVHQLRAQAPTKGKARLAITAKLQQASLGASEGEVTTGHTVSESAAMWLKWLERTARVRPQTLARYRQVATLHIEPHLGSLRLGEVTPARIQEVLLALPEGQRKQSRTALSQMFRFARAHGAMMADPVEPTVLPRTASREPDALTPDQVVQLRAAVRSWGETRTFGPRPTGTLACAVDLMLGTGMRVGEVCALQWQDVDLKAGTVDVKATLTTLDSKAVRQEQAKTERSRRTLFLPPFALSALIELGPKDSGPVLATRKGTHMLPANLRRSLRAACAQAGLDFEPTPHTLRRTLATFLEQSADVKTAADQLGHTNPAITARHYVANTHTGPRAADLIQGLVEEKE